MARGVEVSVVGESWNGEKRAEVRRWKRVLASLCVDDVRRAPASLSAGRVDLAGRHGGSSEVSQVGAWVYGGAARLAPDAAHP